ncbi:MAG: response regulator transcription factor [Terriglobia bacterium]|jgi:DNA-binding NarL/FixJ family response regulator
MANNNGRIHVLIASDHPIFRDGLRQVLEAKAGFEPVGRDCGGGEALQIARKLKPDIILLDLAIAPCANREVVTSLASLSSVRTILLSAINDKGQILELLQLGVRGIVSKESPVEVLIRCMRSVMAGQYWVGRDSVDGIVHALRTLTPHPGSQLNANNFGITSRELEIVAAVTVGGSNKGIAKKLSLSEQTVKHHLTNIFDKLGVSGRLELAVFAAHHRLLSQD